MALIICPECGQQISNKADKCPHCGLPSSYFDAQQSDAKKEEIDYSNINNILISFVSDYNELFSVNHYITHREIEHLRDVYGAYYKTLKNKMVFQYVCNNAGKLHIDVDVLKRFLRRMHDVDDDVRAHNSTYTEETLKREAVLLLYYRIIEFSQRNIRMQT